MSGRGLLVRRGDTGNSNQGKGNRTKGERGGGRRTVSEEVSSASFFPTSFRIHSSVGSAELVVASGTISGILSKSKPSPFSLKFFNLGHSELEFVIGSSLESSA